MLLDLPLFNLQYDTAILHTTFARLLGPPRASSTVLLSIYTISWNYFFLFFCTTVHYLYVSGDMQEHLTTSGELKFFHELVNQLNRQIRGFKVRCYLLVFIDSRIKIAIKT